MIKDLFNKILSSFRDEYLLYSRNSYSKFQSIKLSERNKLSNYEINSAASIIANNYGMYIQEKGEKAIELFLNYLKLYNAPKIDNDELKLISEEIRNTLKSTADFARISMKQYAASKGMERQLRLDTYEIGKELNDRIEPILNKLKIEIDKYNISKVTVSDNSKNKTIRWIIFILLFLIFSIINWAGLIQISSIDNNPNFGFIRFIINIIILLALLNIVAWKHWIKFILGMIPCILAIIGILKL